MVLVLVVGDLHISTRATSIPEPFRKLFTPGRVQTILITGNLGCPEVYDYFKTLCSDVRMVRGDLDYWCSETPESLVVEIENLKIGLIHGHQVVPCGNKDALAMEQRQLDVDVLISGATHVQRKFEFDGHLFIDPGSITGAFTPFNYDVPPTFVLLDIKGDTIVYFAYEYVPEAKEELRIEQHSWTKPA